MRKIEQELVSYAMQNTINDKIQNMTFDIDSISVEILEKIQNILIESYNDEDDFYTLDKIVCTFYEYNLDCGGCHDFG